MPNATVYTEREMKDKYGAFYEFGSKLPLNRRHMPEDLWSLIAYASFWGVADDWARESLVQKAPKDVRENLKAIIAEHDDLLDKWLAGEESSQAIPSLEYVAFSAMRMAADFM